MQNTISNSELRRIKRRRRKEVLRSYIKDYLRSHSCVSCGTMNNLTFHHRNPSEKMDTISKLVSYKSLLKIKQEIAKCDVLCRYCHDKVHGMIRKERNEL